MKKLVSLLSVAAMLLSSFATVFAASDSKVPEDSKATPEIHGEFVKIDDDGTYQFDITYKAGTTLTEMVKTKKGFTGTAINSIDATLKIDPEIWDVTDPDNMVFSDATGGVFPAATCQFNSLTNNFIYTKSTNGPLEYISSEEGHLYTIWLTPKDKNLDGNSVKMDFATALIQIESQANSKITFQTVYSNLSTADYPITTTFGKAPSTIDVTDVTLDKATLDFDLNGTTKATLIATVEPADTTYPTVTWTTDNDKVATVDDKGNVTAVGVGTAKITATAGAEGKEKSASCVVTVVDSAPKPESESSQEKIKEVDGKTLFKIGTIFKNAPATKRISVHSKSANDTKESTKTIAELLNGVAKEGTIDVEITVGILTNLADDVFTFGLVD